MYEIKEFCDKVNVNKPNIFQECKDRGVIRDDAKKIEDLTQPEYDFYTKEVRNHYQNYGKIWPEIIDYYIAYTKPNLVNTNMKTLISSKE